MTVLTPVSTVPEECQSGLQTKSSQILATYLHLNEGTDQAQNLFLSISLFRNKHIFLQLSVKSL